MYDPVTPTNSNGYQLSRGIKRKFPNDPLTEFVRGKVRSLSYLDFLPVSRYVLDKEEFFAKAGHNLTAKRTLHIRWIRKKRELKELSGLGEITYTMMGGHGGSSGGCFVEFRETTDAQRALTALFNRKAPGDVRWAPEDIRDSMRKERKKSVGKRIQLKDGSIGVITKVDRLGGRSQVKYIDCESKKERENWFASREVWTTDDLFEIYFPKEVQWWQESHCAEWARKNRIAVEEKVFFANKIRGIDLLGMPEKILETLGIKESKEMSRVLDLIEELHPSVLENLAPSVYHFRAFKDKWGCCSAFLTSKFPSGFTSVEEKDEERAGKDLRIITIRGKRNNALLSKQALEEEINDLHRQWKLKREEAQEPWLKNLGVSRVFRLAYQKYGIEVLEKWAASANSKHIDAFFAVTSSSNFYGKCINSENLQRVRKLVEMSLKLQPEKNKVVLLAMYANSEPSSEMEISSDEGELV